jgi:hypothetical protein
MKTILGIVFLPLLVLAVFSCKPTLEQQFQNPPPQFKPIPLWHINGEMTTDEIHQQMTDAKELAGFSDVSVLSLKLKRCGNKYRSFVERQIKFEKLEAA